MKSNFSTRRVFTEEKENLLKQYIVICSQMCYGQSVVNLRSIAFDMATISNIKVPSNWIKEKKAGIEWMRLFLKQNSLSIQMPQGCSLSRMTSFNNYNVQKFFTNLEALYLRESKFGDGFRIWNLDETATTNVQRCKKIVTKKGIKQVNSVTSGERGTLVTSCFFISASGATIPPAMILPRKKFKQHMLNNAPSGSLGLANPTGWMNTELFVEVIQHFISKTFSSKENPSLLIFDNHESHLSIKALDLAKNYGVTILTIPPHSSHKMQPLDISVFAPFKVYYNDAVKSWLLNHPGVPITIYEIASCVNIAYEKSFTITNIQSGFRKSGIFPFDKNVFSEADFLCSVVTDRNNPSTYQENTGETLNTNNLLLSPEKPQEPFVSSKPRTSQANDSEVINFVSPSQFKGFPKATERKKKRKPREKASSIIATDTPTKAVLELKEK